MNNPWRALEIVANNISDEEENFTEAAGRSSKGLLFTILIQGKKCYIGHNDWQLLPLYKWLTNSPV